MNRVARMILHDQMRDRTDYDDDYYDAARERRDQARGGRDDYENRRYDRERDRGHYEDHGNYEIRGEYDHEDGARRRSKTTGRYVSDRGESLRLNKHDIKNWEHRLLNADGSRGPHFNAEQVERESERLGIRFDEYSMKEFCMVMNMLYSDFCEVERSNISPDKEAHHYAKMAQAWLEDDDGPMPSEKLALYYHCMKND